MIKLNHYEYSDGWVKQGANWAFNPSNIGWHFWIADSGQEFDIWSSLHLVGNKHNFVPTVDGNYTIYRLHLLDKNDAERLASYLNIKL